MAKRGERGISLSASVLVLFAVAAGAAAGCRNDAQTTPSVASAKPAPPAVASVKPVAYITPAPKVVSSPAPSGIPWTGGAPRSLSRCCSSLAARAWSTPEPHNEYTEQAAETCERAVAAGQKPEIAIGLIAAALRGAVMPMECRP